MLESTFAAVLNMSITALIVAVSIIFFRWIFGRRLPKIFSYAMWAILLLRLIIPFSISSLFSVFNVIPTPQTNIVQSQNYYDTERIISYSMNHGNNSAKIMAGDALSNNINSSLPSPAPEASVDPLQVFAFVASWIWLAGAAGLFLFSMFAYLHTRNKLKTAVLYKCGSLISRCSQKIKLKRKIKIYTSDRIQTPVVCGLIQPRIILPSVFERDLKESEPRHIITHELIHIKRFDYLIKPLSVLVLCVHWFNPVIWMSFILLRKDMEMSCDEKVISVSDHDIRKEYATSLINLAVKQNRLLNCGLLAFGENNTKSRIKGIMSFKKSGFWLGTAVVVILTVIGVILLTNGQFDGAIVNNEQRTVIPDILEVTKTVSDYRNGHIVEVEGRFKSSDNELYLSFLANDAKGGGQLEEGIRKADEITPHENGWFSFRHELIETTGEVTHTKDLTIIFHLKRDGKNDKGLLTVAAKQPPGPPPEPEDESGDTNNDQKDSKGGGERIMSRRVRVQGIITELDMTDDNDIVNSVTLKGTKRIPSPGNPADYDFTDKIIHIVFEERIEEAGVFKNKLKEGAEIVVTFAQYAVPANGKNPSETILGAYLSDTYYVENGKYYDVQGKEAEIIPSSGTVQASAGKRELWTKDGWTYYLEEASGMNGLAGSLCRMDENGVKDVLDELVSTSKYEETIIQAGDRIVFVGFEGTEVMQLKTFSIISIKEDGSDRKTYNTRYQTHRQLCYDKGYIYYEGWTNDREFPRPIIRINTELIKPIKVADINGAFITVHGGYAYFLNDNVYRVKLDWSSKPEIWDEADLGKDVVSVQRIADDELEVYYNSNNEPYILRFSKDSGNEGRLSLNDAIMLSQKGEDPGGSDSDNEPMYISLCTNTEPEDAIDILTEDVAAFISEHRDDI
jgi:beta-lactamase regulating signal transducer with metallopeptidase domain